MTEMRAGLSSRTEGASLPPRARLEDGAPAADLSIEQQLRRAIMRARSKPIGEKHKRWEAVASVFSIDILSAWSLCRKFKLDPNEMVDR